LEGLKVAHDLGQLEDGESHILTLKDSRILDDEGNAYYHLPPPVSLTIRLLDDELQNVEMAEAERVKERNELKIKRRDYTGYDDEEFVKGREGMKRRILSKYDEFLEGPKETVSNVESILSCFTYFELKGFRLGASNLSNGSSTRIEEQVAAPINRALLSIDYTSTSLPSLHASSLTGCPENIQSSDYLQKGDAGFKKPKVLYILSSPSCVPHTSSEQKKASNTKGRRRLRHLARW
jgi:U4/U6.U5 tri-snRNP-associated protein 1